MKYCKRCRREVSNNRWSYKNDICTSCVAKKKYRNDRPDIKRLMKLNKEEILKEMFVLRTANGRLRDSLDLVRKNQIRHFRNRLYKIRNSIDYLLKYPYSVDTGMGGKKHERDKTIRVSQSTIKRDIVRKVLK